MRVNTDGRYQFREDLYDQAGDALGENTRSGGIDAACEFTVDMLAALEEVADHPDLTPELAEALSTKHVELEYHVETGVNVDGRED